MTCEQGSGRHQSGLLELMERSEAYTLATSLIAQIGACKEG